MPDDFVVSVPSALASAEPVAVADLPWLDLQVQVAGAEWLQGEGLSPERFLADRPLDERRALPENRGKN